LNSFSTFDAHLGLHCHTLTDQWPYKEYDQEGRVTGHGERRIYVHVYFDPAKAEAEKAAFYRQLTDVTALVGSQKLSESQQALVDAYLIIPATTDKNKQIRYNEEAIEEKRAGLGYFVLLSNEIKSAQQALELYRNKDVVEKAFANLKNRLSFSRANVSSEESLEGKLFVQYVALMFVSWIHKVMKQEQLYKNWTMQELFDELDTIECFEQNGKRAHYSEVTTKQKTIYSSFNLTPPNML
jgi:transposase